MEDVYKCVSSHWMKTEYDDRVIEWLLLKNNKILVELVFRLIEIFTNFYLLFQNLVIFFVDIYAIGI